MYHHSNVHFTTIFAGTTETSVLAGVELGIFMIYAFVINVIVLSCCVVVLLLLLQIYHSLPKILLLPILILAFSFFLISGESDALLMNRNGVNGLESVFPACRGDVSFRSGLAPRLEAFDVTRDRTGVIGSVNGSPSWLVNDSLDILCPIELFS